MTISNIDNIEIASSTNLSASLTEIACLDEKIQTVAQRIVTANQELNSVETELRQIKPNLDRQLLKNYGFSEEGIALFRRGYQDQVTELKAKKDALKTLIAANHEYLSHYEQQLKKCIAVFDKTYPSYKADQMSGTIMQAKAEGRDPLRIVSWSAGRGVALTQMTPTLHLKWQERANRIFERALSYQRIKDLYLEAILAPYPKTGETGPWKFWLISKDDRVYPNLVACCRLEYRSIIINVDLSDDEILSCLVFELTNAASSRRIEQLEQEVGEGKVSREDYAKTVEKIEHEGAMRHHAIMKHAVTEMGWDPSLDRFKDLPKHFEMFWAENKNSQHAENSRKRWELFVKEDHKAAK